MPHDVFGIGPILDGKMLSGLPPHLPDIHHLCAIQIPDASQQTVAEWSHMIRTLT